MNGITLDLWVSTLFHFDFRSTKESIAETAHVVGALERVWSNSVLITKDQLATLPADHGKIWVFRRCLIAGVLFHSMSYKRVVARNDYTIEFQHQGNKLFGSIHTYAKVEKKCQKALCDDRKCSCYLPSHYLAIVEILDQADDQLPRYRDRTVINHITRVKKSGRYCLWYTSEKLLCLILWTKWLVNLLLNVLSLTVSEIPFQQE